MCHNILVLKREEKSTEASETKFYLQIKKHQRLEKWKGRRGKNEIKVKSVS